MPDCGDNSCLYATTRGGMRTNGGCRCDRCEVCGATIHPSTGLRHRIWCTQPSWIPHHHTAEGLRERLAEAEAEVRRLNRDLANARAGVLTELLWHMTEAAHAIPEGATFRDGGLAGASRYNVAMACILAIQDWRDNRKEGE